MVGVLGVGDVVPTTQVTCVVRDGVEVVENVVVAVGGG